MLDCLRRITLESCLDLSLSELVDYTDVGIVVSRARCHLRTFELRFQGQNSIF